MKLKAILADFDGTIVSNNLQYNPNLKTFIEKIKNNNIHFSLATGRAYYSYADKIINELNLSDFHIFQGGSLIYNNKTKQILFIQPISQKSVKGVIVYLIKNKIKFAVETHQYAYMSKIIIKSDYTPKEFLKPLANLNNYSQVLKILIFPSLNNLNLNQVETIKEDLDSLCKDITVMKFIHNGKAGFDITSEKATKHTAVLAYEKLLGIPKEQMVGIGDGLNDYPLLTACGYKIAMGNAPEELKDIADFIAPTIENNGTEVALKHIISKFNI